MNLTREVVINPAYDKRSPDPSKSYGIHGADMIFYLRRPKGVVQFVVYTNWYLPNVRLERDSQDEPIGADVGYHSPTPIYEGQIAMDCNLLPGGKCYYGGSGLMALDLLETLIAKGSEAVWKELEQFYKDKFGE